MKSLAVILFSLAAITLKAEDCPIAEIKQIAQQGLSDTAKADPIIIYYNSKCEEINRETYYASHPYYGWDFDDLEAWQVYEIRRRIGY